MYCMYVSVNNVATLVPIGTNTVRLIATLTIGARCAVNVWSPLLAIDGDGVDDDNYMRYETGGRNQYDDDQIITYNWCGVVVMNGGGNEW